ncbi:hypothetical protein EXE46_08005 [Halorubrum sp. GN11_10-6_MGM]|uniref:hypothetical protein n=1 Tax=Halorubrum sp. GN11_10-6_MGM TaxID=2518112 RepID=UPI0010F79261|nr:hypothetical protein [Halorubrum sp. GN11_10-6_MGM]TKX74636.1 hypothetical protein EXE46_08005 [Halorubrum sp. GN11_10-6_MGM]
METTAKLEYGVLEVEIHAFDEEDYQKEVLDLIQFIEDNQDSLDELSGVSDTAEINQSKSEVKSLEEFGESNQTETEIETIDQEEESGPLADIASELRISEHKLDNFVYVDPQEEDFPVLYIDEMGDIGNRKTDRQRISSLILLYVWHECYDVERIKSSSLKDALELSDVSSSGMGNMYQGEGDRYFDRRGRGPSATVSLTPPGKRQARKLLKRFTQDDKSE